MCSLLFSFVISSKLNIFVIYNKDSSKKKKKKKIKAHPNVINYFKELPFYNKYVEKPKIKRLKNIDLLSELPFYEELNVIKRDRSFRGYAMSHKVKISEKKDPLIQLEASK